MKNNPIDLLVTLIFAGMMGTFLAAFGVAGIPYISKLNSIIDWYAAICIGLGVAIILAAVVTYKIVKNSTTKTNMLKLITCTILGILVISCGWLCKYLINSIFNNS